MESEGTPLEAVPGVGPAIAMKLRVCSILNAEYLARQSPTDLQWKTKLGEATLQKIVTKARELLGYEFQSGLDIESARSTCLKFATGLEVVDKKLFGGLPIGSLVEIYGPSRGGKTHLLSQFAVRAQLPPDQGGLETRVLWLTTGKSFRPLPIRAAAVRYEMDGDIALGNIAVKEVVNREHLSDILKTLPEHVARSGLKLIIIDSLGALFQIEYSPLESRRYIERELAQMMVTLRNIAKSSEGICLYTNQVYEHLSSYGGNPNSAMNGHVMSHASDYRFYLRRRMRERRGLALQKAPDVPEFDAEFEIGWGGFYPDRTERKHSERAIYGMLDGFFPRVTTKSEGVETIG